MDLHQAIIKGDFLLARKLIESGARVNGTDEDKRTPLMICSLHDGETWALGVARILLMHAAKVGISDKKGRNALIYAVLYERQDLVELFLKALDYDLNHSDCEGCTALWYAAKLGNVNIATVLLKCMKKYSLDVDKPNNYGFTPLIQACHLGHQQCATVLRNLGKASDTIKDDIHSRTFKKSSAELVSSAPGKDWRLDLRCLTDALQCQISPSYRSMAKPLPPRIGLCRKNLNLDRVNPGLKALLQQKRRRKMSIDAINDVLLKDNMPKNNFRRRCSVAVIPLIRLSIQRKSSTQVSESGEEERKTPKSQRKSVSKKREPV
ncbi:UNVERIFIED_CONTAM: hypothetical protein FKN15_056106 [Acipenser sinensis]